MPAAFQRQKASGWGSGKPARWNPLLLYGPFQLFGERGGAACVLELQKRPLCSLAYISHAAVSWRTLERQTTRRAVLRGPVHGGRGIAPGSPMIPLTPPGSTRGYPPNPHGRAFSALSLCPSLPPAPLR